jgi:hypothetical protein
MNFQNYFLNFVFLFLKDILSYFFWFIRNFYWLIIFFILAKIYFNYRISYLKKKEKEEKEIKDWTIFEIKITKDTEGGPKTMENFLSNLKSFTKGYFSLELIGMQRSVHFYLRFPTQYQKLIESLIYSSFPRIVFEKVEDYFSYLPPFLPNKEYDLWGTEFVLEKADPYPIKTYPFFLSDQSNGKTQTEVLASFSEIVNKLNEKELYIIQIIFRPLTFEEEGSFVEKAKLEEDIVLGKKAPEKKITAKDWAIAFIINLLTGVFREPVWPQEPEKKEPVPPSFSQQEKANFIERKLNKQCFETGIRVLYISPKNIFDEINTLGFLSYFNQFDFKNLNSFKVNDNSTTEATGRFFLERKTLLKKINFYKKAIKRDFPEIKFILSSEELATIYHFPSGETKIPSISQILFRKGEPPPFLPTD